ncbi:alpha/beta hydrolase [Pararhodobacter sp.]|uniref:alpha/beta fold hydrolase n=1 Tax=Pararhodobacter sp. TaxID=2127056 RepID=UPI002AFFF3C5|nr:alpha/beta hydrolase [Pararhodobacter sp.]
MPMPAPLMISVLAVAGLAGCAALVDTRADRREAGWEAQTPPLGQFIEVEGHRIHVFDAGRPNRSAQDVVLIHGANGNLRDFTFDLVGRLESNYRVIAVDRPGLGYSDSLGEADSDPREQARVLRLALEHLGVRRPIVVGHSYGGSVAMGFALQSEAQTAGVVLLAGATHPWDTALGGWYRLNDTPLGRPARATVAAFAPESMVATVLDSVFSPTPIPEGYVAYFGPNLSIRRDSQANNTRQVNDLLTYVTEMQPAYADLTLPIEILHGDQDTIVGLEIHSRRMAAEAPGAVLTILPDTGHMPHHSHPDAVVDAIDRIARRARS